MPGTPCRVSRRPSHNRLIPIAISAILHARDSPHGWATLGAEFHCDKRMGPLDQVVALRSVFTFFSALGVSMAIIPVTMRLAPRLGMIDRPDARKVHTKPVPRVGGIGIAVGTLLPLVLWAPATREMHAYLFGAVVLVAFGAWDDCRELGHYVKFIGQFIAVLALVFYGGVVVNSLPFINEIPASVGKPFTVFAIVGMINAINHSDGLDGLAGGLSMLSMTCIAYLAFQAHGHTTFDVAVAAIAGVMGFLRYNTYPAMVFMGDGGSQFLGFTLGFLAVQLTQNVNPALSPALPALLLGLPIIDILAVFAQRVYHKMNWFRATKNHIHHRLLALGFDHHEAVMAIYAIQTLFVISAVVLKYNADGLILGLYFGVCVALFSFIWIAERTHWRAHREGGVSRLAGAFTGLKSLRAFQALPGTVITVMIPSLFVIVSMVTPQVPQNMGVGAALLVAVLLADILWVKKDNSVVLQAVIYVTAAFVVYLSSTGRGWVAVISDVADPVYFVGLAAAIGLAIRYGSGERFRITPMDYLIIIIVIFSGTLFHSNPTQAGLSILVIKLVIVFYGCEFILNKPKPALSALNVSTLVTLVVLSMRGLI